METIAPFNENDLTKDHEEEEQIDPFAQLMNRGSYLRQLRMLALHDEMERLAEEQNDYPPEVFEEKKCDDLLGITEADKLDIEETQVLPTGERLLNYNAYLSHQRYYDDLKHVDFQLINFGCFGSEKGGELIVEQRKQLGKGGFCWDAGFILGEHVISRQEEWNTPIEGGETTVLELGAGTGLCGLMLAKATSANVTITDLPELVGLMKDNLKRNSPYQSENVEARTLRWGHEEDYDRAPYDVIMGADIVASLYDPVALAQTLHALSGPRTKIYISSKSRLDKPHEEFDVEMGRLFKKVERLMPESRLRNPNVFLMVFGGKREL